MKHQFGQLISLPKIVDPRGNLTVAEQLREVPFEIKRCFWMYGVPKGKGRGGHAHKTLRQFVVSMCGKFSVTLDNGNEKETFVLDSPDKGLFIDKCVWAELFGFSDGAVCLVLASDLFKEEDYLGTYSEFMDYISAKDEKE